MGPQQTAILISGGAFVVQLIQLIVAVSKDRKNPKAKSLNWENSLAALALVGTGALVAFLIFTHPLPCDALRQHLHKTLAGSVYSLRSTISGHPNAGVRPDFDWHAIESLEIDDKKMEKLMESLENHANNLDRHVRAFQGGVDLATTFYMDSSACQDRLIDSRAIGKRIKDEIISELRRDNLTAENVVGFRDDIVAQLDKTYLEILQSANIVDQAILSKLERLQNGVDHEEPGHSNAPVDHE